MSLINRQALLDKIEITPFEDYGDYITVRDLVAQFPTANRKTESSSEKPNNCDTCRHNKLEWYSEVCDGCSKAHSNYEPKDEPQTEMTTEQIVNELLSIKKILADGKMPKQTHDIRTETHECVKDTHDKTGSDSENPNNCKYAENPSGDVWECGCFLDTYCEHQIYDRNPDGTINIVKCGYEPKTEPTPQEYEKWLFKEPQTERGE